MGDMGDDFNALKEALKLKRRKHLADANAGGWTQHTEYHWSRDLCGDRLDYWPSRTRFRWRGKTYVGDVDGFIRNRQEDEA